MSGLLRPIINKLSDGQFHSGPELGEFLSISRAAVWKQIRKANTLGLDVHSVRGKGYRMPEPVCLLDQGSILGVLGKRANNALQQLEILESTDSTNSHAMRMIQSGNLLLQADRYAVFLAEQQSSGKGRRGRQWVSPYGRNIYMTMVRLVDAGSISTEGISLVIGLATLRALNALGISDAGVKWPNDIIYQDKKLAGILLEISGDITGICQLLVGIGINTRCSPEAMAGVAQPWTDLYRITGMETDRNRLASELISQVMTVLAEFEAGGMASFRQEWQQHDVMYNKEVELFTPGSRRTGTAMGIAESGALILETGAGRILVNGGEISLRRADS